jgi:hypothetical protein
MAWADELRPHVRRLAAWSAASLAAGAAGSLKADPFWSSFWLWTAGWATVNLLVCAVSARGKPPSDLRKLREFLVLNEGLNLGYIGVGAALGLASPVAGVQGAGWAVFVQGLALLVLDTWLLVRLPKR